MLSIVEYMAPETLTSTITARAVIMTQIRSYEDAVTEVQRMLSNNNWKLTGFNEEDYFWAREASPSRRRRILRIEQ